MKILEPELYKSHTLTARKTRFSGKFDLSRKLNNFRPNGFRHYLGTPKTHIMCEYGISNVFGKLKKMNFNFYFPNLG